jgi:hypothetical protein
MRRPRGCNVRAASCFVTRCFATLLSMRFALFILVLRRPAKLAVSKDET